MNDKTKYFEPENEVKKETHVSPSGRYKLEISEFKTKAGCWNYSQCIVFKIDSDKPIDIIQRNIEHFPFKFIESHSNGHDYLICGENYQGQTVIELDTGKKRTQLSKGAEKGHGFCWSQVHIGHCTDLLAVSGCIWAGPYEIRFFDFSDPMNGWPELETDDWVHDDEHRPPFFSCDGTIECFQSEWLEFKEGMTDEEYDALVPRCMARKVFKRDGDRMTLIEEWQHDEEKERRRRNEEAQKKWKEWRDDFRKTDTLYLEYLELLKRPELSPDDYETTGVTYEHWCPDFEERETRWCRRIVDGKKSLYTVDIEWAVKTGPIKLTIYKDKKKLEDKFFTEHSVDSMRAAFDCVRSLLSES